MDIPGARDLISVAQESLDRAQLALAEPPPEPPQPEPPVCHTAADLDAALAAAAPGAVIRLAPELTYAKPLTLAQAVTLEATPIPEGRMTRDVPLPRFAAGLTVPGDNVSLVGLDVRNGNHLTDIVVLTGANVIVDRCRVLGDPVEGAKRGIATNTNGNARVLRCYVADCFQASPGNDSQAIGGWNMAPGLLVSDCYLEGGSETVMFGGADAPEDRTPSDIVFTGNTITKNPAWMGQKIGVKNLIELKNAKRVIFKDNVGSYSWTQGQVGFLLTLTVRNQDGRAPWATIQDVTFTGNRWAHGACAVAILGRDDIKESKPGRPVPIGAVRPSVPMARVSIVGDTFAVDPATYGGGSSAVKAIQIAGAPYDITIEDVTITSASAGSSAVYYGTSAQPVTGMRLVNVTLPTTKYGMFGEGAAVAPKNFTATNPAWAKYVVGGTIDAVTTTPPATPATAYCAEPYFSETPDDGESRA